MSTSSITGPAKASRQAFGEALAALGEKHTNIVVLDADLSKSTKSELFMKKFPQRFFEMGIAEQNMLGVSAGLASAGKNAFCCSFACFVAGRFETIKMSVAYPKANVKIVGTHAGIGIGPDGYSQMGLEDLALMRTLPGMLVLQPGDEVETKAMMAFLAAYNGPAYLRLTRQDLAAVHGPDYQFHLGRFDTLVDGSDIAIFATGGTVQHAVAAAKRLLDGGISVAVINVPSIKPIDKVGVANWAQRVRAFITVEDHNVIGGLGGAIAEALAEVGGPPLYRHGMHDVVGESGEPDELYAKYRLDADGIVAVAAEVAGAIK